MINDPSDDQKIVENLSKIGIKVHSIYDLVNTTKSYPEAIPVLLDGLSWIKNNKVKEGVVRALSVPEAKGVANQKLIAEFEAIPSNSTTQEQMLKWTIGSALAVVANRDNRDDLVRIAMCRRHGRSREMIVLALGNLPESSVGKVLTALLTDEDVALQAVIAIRKTGYIDALPTLYSMRMHSKPLMRKEVERAIKKLSNTAPPVLENP